MDTKPSFSTCDPYQCHLFPTRERYDIKSPSSSVDGTTKDHLIRLPASGPCRWAGVPAAARYIVSSVKARVSFQGCNELCRPMARDLSGPPCSPITHRLRSHQILKSFLPLRSPGLPVHHPLRPQPIISRRSTACGGNRNNASARPGWPAPPPRIPTRRHCSSGFLKTLFILANHHRVDAHSKAPDRDLNQS